MRTKRAPEKTRTQPMAAAYRLHATRRGATSPQGTPPSDHILGRKTYGDPASSRNYVPQKAGRNIRLLLKPQIRRSASSRKLANPELQSYRQEKPSRAAP